jgi:hypothetical protein
MGVRDHGERVAHLALLKRVLDLRLRDDVRAKFEDMLDEMTTQVPRRCAHGEALFKQWKLTAGQERWALGLLGEEPPPAHVRLTSGGVPRGREVPTPVVLLHLPMKPPGRA